MEESRKELEDMNSAESAMKAVANAMYMIAKANGADEKVLEALREYLNSLK
mgnify:CR=1 FL=1